MKIKPNYKCSCSSSGYIEDLSKKAQAVYGTPCSWKWPRWFDNKSKTRRVFVKIERFYGDYHHVYAEIHEEDNPYWLPPDKEHPEGTWVNDAKSSGMKFTERFNTEEGARTYVDLIIREHFPNHLAVTKESKYSDINKTWHYSKEGD